MKIRIRGNSIRLRLGRSEVERLASKGSVDELTIFGSGEGDQLRYEIRAVEHETAVRASFDGGRIIVHVPADTIECWIGSDQVGIYAMQPTPQGVLAVLVEKDFACVDGDSGESQEDAFPNPMFSASSRTC
jgi:hypothetical protein